MSSKTVVAGPRNGITVGKIEKEVFKKPLTKLTTPKSYSGKKDIVIEGFDFRGLNKKDQKQCNVGDCENVVIRRSIFGNKTTKGVALNIVGAKTKNVIIEYCIFENMTYTADNGAEPLRLGLSDYSGLTYNVTVKNCIFRNLRSDPECISIKSCGNTVEDSFFINNKSNITVRHGGFATIQHNYLGNGGGIRIHGYGNKALYNCIENNQDDESFAPIQVRYGDADKDANFTDPKTPSGKAKDVDPVYARCMNTIVANNEFKNCRVTVIELKKNGNLRPVNTTNKDNKVVQKFGFETPPTPPKPIACVLDGTADDTVEENVVYRFPALCDADKAKIDAFIESLKNTQQPPPAPPIEPQPDTTEPTEETTTPETPVDENPPTG